MRCFLLSVILLSLAVCAISKDSSIDNGIIKEASDEDESVEVESEEDADDEILVSSVPKRKIRSTSVEYDEDEFEGIPARQHPIPKRAGKPVTENSFLIEVAAGMFIAVYLINFFIGVRANNKIAQKWYETIKSDLEDQFHCFERVGGYTANDILFKESHFCFKLYASGRRYCHGILATLDLKRRQDLYSVVLSLVGYAPAHDTMTIEIPMSEDDMGHFVFCICKTKQERFIRKSNTDLDNYSHIVKATQLPDSLTILTDTPELVPEFLNPLVLRTINNNIHLFELLHFSDQGSVSFNSSTRVLRFKFQLSEDIATIKTLTRMSLFFIDQAATTKLPQLAAKRAIDKRRQVADRLYRSLHNQRQEAITKKREETQKKKKEKETAAAERKEEKQRASSAVKRNKVKTKLDLARR